MNNKAAEVNGYLRNMYKEYEIPFVDYGEHINARKHLNRSRLDLNEKGSFILGKNFLDHIKFFFVEMVTIIVWMKRKNERKRD